MKVAVIQCALPGPDNTEKVIHWIEAAAKEGAQVILSPELFRGPYFCKQQREAEFERALSLQDPWFEPFRMLAKNHGLVLPISFFEREGPHFYNSLQTFGPQGERLGHYRKTHLPDGPGYQEKYYFRPGNLGLRAIETPWGKLGFGICWDQWFPEVARLLVLDGAECLLYPTAIGSEPQDPELDTRMAWQRAMCGHAASNSVPVLAANRIGLEGEQRFYGHSFLCVELDLEQSRQRRQAFGFFRDRRGSLYKPLTL
jgi:N-carbamoylputrescine amidase